MTPVDRSVNFNKCEDQIEKWTSPLDRGHKNTQNRLEVCTIWISIHWDMDLQSSSFKTENSVFKTAKLPVIPLTLFRPIEGAILLGKLWNLEYKFLIYTSLILWNKIDTSYTEFKRNWIIYIEGKVWMHLLYSPKLIQTKPMIPTWLKASEIIQRSLWTNWLDSSTSVPVTGTKSVLEPRSEGLRHT